MFVSTLVPNPRVLTPALVPDILVLPGVRVLIPALELTVLVPVLVRGPRVLSPTLVPAALLLSGVRVPAQGLGTEASHTWSGPNAGANSTCSSPGARHARSDRHTRSGPWTGAQHACSDPSAGVKSAFFCSGACCAHSD